MQFFLERGHATRITSIRKFAGASNPVTHVLAVHTDFKVYRFIGINAGNELLQNCLMQSNSLVQLLSQVISKNQIKGFSFF